MKLARPRSLDSVALCVGTMMPDLMYSFSSYVGIDTHRWPAAFAYGVPLGTLLAIVIRRVVAPVVPDVVPDAGPFRLRSYGVLATRRPSTIVTLLSVTLGIGSHVTLDWFTHPGRPGVRWLGYENIEVTAFGITEPLAGVFQLIGHTFGSLVGIWLLWFIAHRRLLEDWYGNDRVAAVRARPPHAADRLKFWVLVVLGLAAGAVWGLQGELIELIQRTAVGALIACIVGSVAIGGLRQATSSPTRTTS